MTTSSTDLAPKITERIAPGYFYHIPLHGKALDMDELARLRHFVHQLVTTLTSTKSLQAQYFVQMRRLDKEPWSDLLSTNAQFWTVKVGLGIRPGKPLPAPPTLKDTLSPKVRTPSELVYKIDKDPHIHIFLPNHEIPSPINVYLGCGGCEVFLVAKPNEFLPKAKKIFANELHPAYAGLGFCLPLLGLKDFTSASVETIRVWFDLFDVFIAEVQDEPGVLIASREPIAQPLAGLQHILDG